MQRFSIPFRRSIRSILCSALVVSLALPGFGGVPAQKHKKKTLKKTSSSKQAANGPVVPVGTQMKIRLEDTIDSNRSREGDRFTATILTPNRFADGKLEGHLAQIKESGKFEGRTAIDLVFDRITFREGGSRRIGGQVVRIYGESSVKEVDEEGSIKGGKRSSSTVKRTAGGAAAGAIIGAIAGGGKGAAIGAGIGAGVGAGSQVIRGSDKVRLESGTEMLIRTTR